MSTTIGTPASAASGAPLDAVVSIFPSRRSSVTIGVPDGRNSSVLCTASSNEPPMFPRRSSATARTCAASEVVERDLDGSGAVFSENMRTEEVTDALFDLVLDVVERDERARDREREDLVVAEHAERDHLAGGAADLVDDLALALPLPQLAVHADDRVGGAEARLLRR